MIYQQEGKSSLYKWVLREGTVFYFPITLEKSEKAGIKDFYF